MMALSKRKSDIRERIPSLLHGTDRRCSGLISLTYLSITVMIGQIRAPATAALAVSAAKRSPKLRVFHSVPDLVAGIGMAGIPVWAASRDIMLVRSVLKECRMSTRKT